MRKRLFVVLAFAFCSGVASASDLSLPPGDIDLIQTADDVEVAGTNDAGGAEDFAIHDRKAINAFIDLLISNRFMTAPKSLKPQFKSLSNYEVRLSSKGALIMKLHIIAESVLDIPGDSLYYVETDQYADDNLMAPLLRLR